MEPDKRKVAILSNITIDLLIAKLRSKYDFYQPEGYDTWVQEVINPISGLYGFRADVIIVLLDGMEARKWKNETEAAERISVWKQAIDGLICNFAKIPIFISTIDFLENRIKSLSERRFKYKLQSDWYEFIQGKAESNKNVYIFDISDVISDVGRNQFYSNKMWYLSSMPYSREGLAVLSQWINRILNAVFTPRKKIIALDLDNTLWGGVVGEDGVDGIELSDHKEGQRFYDFQRQLLEMKKRGVVLGIVSKNNQEDAEAAIQTHPSMLLRDEAFVNKKINWDNKVTNLKMMENELNLTEGSFVFIDDNPVERESVKGECSEIYVPDFPTDTTELLPFAENIWFDCCLPLRVLGDDLKKTQMYQSDAKRKEEMRTSLNIDDYIRKLGMVVDIHRMRNTELERVVQLINKTNQFNLTTKRYTQAEIEEISLSSENAIYVVYNSDKYGDNGLISVVILKEKGDEVVIDSFLMSCRVMGRKCEDVIINELASRRLGKTLVGEYIPTAKNAPVKDLFDRLGFTNVSNENGHKKYELKNYQKRRFDIYKEIRFGDED